MSFFLLIFAQKQIMLDREKLGQTEHQEVLLDNVSKLVINRNYIIKNMKFFEAVIFKLYEDYLYSPEQISITKQAKILEAVLGCMIKYKPSLELPEDEI